MNSNDYLRIDLLISGIGILTATSVSCRRMCILGMKSFYLALFLTVTLGQPSIESKILNLVEKSEFSGSILQYKDGHVTFDKAYGLADRENQIKNEPHFKYNLGSINKLFTKIAVAQLLQQGKLNLDDFAITYVPELTNKNMDKITIVHLLAMRSGLGDYLENSVFIDHKENFLTMENYLSIISMSELIFEPGTNNHYSNLGYELLGIIIGRISEMDYHSYIQTYILDVAQMSNTGYFTQKDKVSNIAVGYIKTDDIYRPNWSEKSFKGTAAGGGYSTTHDMLNLALMLFDHQLLDETYTRLLFKNFQADSERGSHIFIAGGGPGINATFYLNRQKKEVVIVLANQDSPAASAVNNIFKAVGGGKKSPKKKK